MNIQLTTETISDIACSIDYMLDVCEAFNPRTLRDMVYGIFTPAITGFEGSPVHERRQALARNIVDAHGVYESSRTYGLLAEACHDIYFCAMYSGGEMHPCMACGAEWSLDGSMQAIDHDDTCAYLHPLLEADREILFGPASGCGIPGCTSAACNIRENDL